MNQINMIILACLTKLKFFNFVAPSLAPFKKILDLRRYIKLYKNGLKWRYYKRTKTDERI